MGWSVWFWGCRVRRNDAKWPFHSKELQRNPVPKKPCNPSRNELDQKVKLNDHKKLL